MAFHLPESFHVPDHKRTESSLCPRLQQERKEIPLLKENPLRFLQLPILYPDIQRRYKKHVACFWTAEEIELDKDPKDWKRLDRETQSFIEHHLAYLNGSDGAIVENLGACFLTEVQFPEARNFYGFQIAMENIHAETYGVLIETLIADRAKAKKLMGTLDDYPSIQAKTAWAQKWIDPNRSFVERLIAFACVEAIHFSSSFCAFFWLKKKGYCPGACFANELISRDEGMHQDFAVMLYNDYIADKFKLSQEHIFEIVRGAVEVEVAFNVAALPTPLVGMNVDLMDRYIKYIADRLLMQLGCDKQYNTENPFQWMEKISLQGKTNFFEKRVGEYQKAGVLDGETEFILDEDF